MIDRSDPEFPKQTETLIAIATGEFARGEMTETVYAATLYRHGMRGEAIRDEIRTHRPMKTLGEHAKPIFARLLGE